MPKEKIFIGLREIAGMYVNLTQGLRELGYRVTCTGGASHRFQYGTDTNLPALARWFEHSRKRSAAARKSGIEKIALSFTSGLAKRLFFLYALVHYDVFIFVFGRSFFNNGADLPVLKLCGKKILSHIGHGSEARPPFLNGALQSHDGTSYPSAEKLALKSSKMKQRLKRIEKWSDIVICAPFTSHFLEKPFVNFFNVGLSRFFKDASRAAVKKNGLVRVLHSPSHPAAKGSPIIKAAVESLIRKGHGIDFVEISGKPHSAVVAELEKCDFVVDQLYSDTPLAGFATEAAWFGKPAVVGGYGWEELSRYIPAGSFPPSEICHPDAIESAIEKLLLNPEYRLDLGRRAFEFVNKQWSRKQVAQRYIKLVEGNIPEEWYCNPKDIVYLTGACFPRCRIKAVVGEIIKKLGVQALQLSHRKDLEDAFVEFSESNGKEA